VTAGGWHSAEVRDALDLCLACKGCRTECPVGVDMATYKAEFLAHHYAGRPRPAAHDSMGWLPAIAGLLTAVPGVPGLVNLAGRTPGLSSLATRAGGIDRRRDLPRFAGQPFTAWYRRHGPAPAPRPRRPRGTSGAETGKKPRVVLWPDTFGNYFHPEIPRAALTVLQRAGFAVQVPTRPLCCGLTWISTGQLGVARRVLRRTVKALPPGGQLRLRARALRGFRRLRRARAVARGARRRPGDRDAGGWLSCRTQLAAGRTGHRGWHLAQLLAEITSGSP
jgi:Fe-S oxidoreductase